MVEFHQDGQHVLWRFHQPAEGIAPDFGRLVNSFTVATLGAAFVPLPAENSHSLAIYLPEPAATELSEMLAETRHWHARRHRHADNFPARSPEASQVKRCRDADARPGE